MTTQNQPPQQRQPGRFLSLRWRFMSPLFVGVLVIALAGAYILTSNISGGLLVSQENILLQSAQAVADRSARLYNLHLSEAQRVAFTIGVPEAVRDNRPEALDSILKTLAQINEMDALIVTNTLGIEVLGIQRVETSDSIEFAISSNTDLSADSTVTAVIESAQIGTSNLFRTPGGMMLFTGVPIYLGDEFIGVALVGQRLSSVLNDVKGSAVADLAFYGGDGDLLQTSLDAGQRQALALDSEVFSQALGAVRQIPVEKRQLGNAAYQVAYQPFVFGQNTLGVVGVLMPDSVPFVTETGRRLTALLVMMLTGIVVTVGYAGISHIAHRADAVAHVARDLAAGQDKVRTKMLPTDEISAVGHALDQYADYAQQKHDALRHVLRRQRREANHLMAILESLPGGVIVQDIEGRVIIMNDLARHLLGSQRVFRSSGLHELAGVVQQKLGVALAPGIYILGDPHRIHLDERVLNAQAAAVLANTNQRIGTVILLEDITGRVIVERERDAMLQRLARDIQLPLAGLGRLGLRVESDLMKVFTREVTRQAVALQKMIVDLRELNNVDMLSIKRRQVPLAAETLLWAVANEWRQVAQANHLTLHVIIERKGLFVLGDEKRLRWAIGNIMDNAVKYTLPGGALTLEIQEEAGGMANLRVRDNGVGIAKSERQFIFTRFYRGTPETQDGEVIHVPGMGQGLFIAKQIFESHGGSLRLKSSQGVGTAVYMSLPLTEPTGMELPRLQVDMDGETVQLPENMLVDLDQ